MKFAHLADAHIGAWRDPALKELSMKAFEQAVNTIIAEKVDFALIAGDLFNTAIPPLDLVKRTVNQLQRLKRANTPVYAIAGSHDYSPSGKTMIDVLEAAGLLKNVMKGSVNEAHQLELDFTTDEKTNVKLTGILGRAGSLDKQYYEDLNRAPLENEPGEKIFLFHAPLTELKTKELAQMESQPTSNLPKGFKYYAGGHVHITNDTSLPGYELVAYPGPVYPANYYELETLGHGSMIIVDNWKITRVPINVKERVVHTINAEKKTTVEVNAALDQLSSEDVKDKILLLRVKGELADGRVSDVNVKGLATTWRDNGAYTVLKNTSQLTSKEYAEYATTSHDNAAEVEERVIKEHVGQVTTGLTVEDEAALTKTVLDVLGAEQSEGEKKYEYEERILKETKTLLSERMKR